MVQKIFKFLIPILVSVLGVYLANQCNIFDYISFIPKDKSFDICISTYFIILDIFIVSFIEFIEEEYMSELKVTISKSNTVPEISSTPIIEFNAMDLAEAIVNVEITGRKKNFLNSTIVFSNVNFATMQASVKEKGSSVDSDGNYIINLEEIFGASDMRIATSATFKISLVKEPIEGERTIEMIPELKKGTFHPLIIYKNNKAILKLER